MPKMQRRRLLNSSSTPDKPKTKIESRDGEVWSARGRLQGALQEVLEPPTPLSEHDDDDSRESVESVSRQPYVLKLFDRSVDLAQFSEHSPLYPVCRAWILNRPRVLYAQSREDEEDAWSSGEGVTLPAAEAGGSGEERVPALLPEQQAASKNNLDHYLIGGGGVSSRDRLLHAHVQRWGAVRDAWLAHARTQQARYKQAQQTLNMLHVTM